KRSSGKPTKLMKRLMGSGRRASCNACPVLFQERAQHRAVAALLVLAVATHREACFEGKRREQPQEADLLGRRHLRAISLLEPGPSPRLIRCLRELHEPAAGGELMKPDVVPILRRVPTLGYAPGRV